MNPVEKGALVCCVRFWYTHNYPAARQPWYVVADADTGEIIRETCVSAKDPGTVNSDGMWFFADKTRNVRLFIGPCLEKIAQAYSSSFLLDVAPAPPTPPDRVGEISVINAIMPMSMLA